MLSIILVQNLFIVCIPVLMCCNQELTFKFVFRAFACLWISRLWGLGAKHKGKGSYMFYLRIYFLDQLIFFSITYLFQLFWLDRTEDAIWHPKNPKRCPVTLVPCTGWIPSSRRHSFLELAEFLLISDMELRWRKVSFLKLRGGTVDNVLFPGSHTLPRCGCSIVRIFVNLYSELMELQEMIRKQLNV